MAMKHDDSSICDTPLREEVSRTEVFAWDEHPPKVEASKSETSLGSEESSVLEETFMSEAPNLEFASVPEVGAKSRYFLGEDVSPEALLGEEPFPREEEPRTMPVELLPGLCDPFAEIEAKLARLSSTVAGADVPRADTPEVPTQVAVVVQKCSGQSSAGDREVMGRSQVSNLCGSEHHLHHRHGALASWSAQGTSIQGSGKEKLCLVLRKPLGKLGSRYKAMAGGHLSC